MEYVDPPLSQERALALYNGGLVFKGRNRDAVFAAIAEELHARVPPGRLLDVGCGAGGFMQYAASRGWEVVGVDINSAAVETAQTAGLDARYGTIADIEETASFDSVVLMNSFEYFADPLRTLQRIYALLDRGGAVIFEMPNTAWHRKQTQVGRILGLPEHRLMSPSPYPERRLFAYHRRAMEILLHRSGFGNVSARPAPARDEGGQIEQVVRRGIASATASLYRASGGRALLTPSILVGATKIARR